VTIAIITGIQTVGFVQFQLPYLEKFPKMNCTFANGQVKQDCQPAVFCDAKDVTVEIDWTDPDSLHNWVEKLDLTCQPSWKIGMLGSAFFIGWICTILIIPRQSDTKGRKILWQVGMILQTPCFVVMFWTQSLDVMIGVIFLFGALNSCRLSIGYVYLSELMPK